MTTARTSSRKAKTTKTTKTRGANPTLPIEPEIQDVIQREVMKTFRAGWDAHRRFIADALKSLLSMTELGDLETTVNSIATVGDRAWVNPLAIIEETATHRYSIDPRFPVSREPSMLYSTLVEMTELGLTAVGPAGGHRVCEDAGRQDLRPLVSFGLVSNDLV